MVATKTASTQPGKHRVATTASHSRPAIVPESTEIPPIVGIGASAGGHEAFTQLLHALPPNPGLAFVLVQHLNPHHESILAKLLSRATPMPVTEVKKSTRVQSDHVYVIGPNDNLILKQGVLYPEICRAAAGGHKPIDHFFRSLAEDQGARAIGVVLSGTASDGTLGLKAIKSKGGITFAQKPESALYDGMPRSAIAAGCVDLVLTPDRTATELMRLSGQGYLEIPKAEECEAPQSLPVTRENEFGQFFRDPDLFHALETTVLPRMIAGKLPGEPIRVWVPEASAGEEVYSIAISLMEALGNRPNPPRIQIFGTDRAEKAIERARNGRYPDSTLHQVAPDLLRRYFVKEEGHYHVMSALREVCFFARHDLAKDPPFSRLDLISFRNVPVHIEPALLSSVLAALHYALRAGGYLLLRESETLNLFPDLFSVVDQERKIFVKEATPRAAGAWAPASSQTLQGPVSPGEKLATMLPSHPSAAAEAEIRRLQIELKHLREKLQSTILEMETANEELKTANEEAMTSMEELQITNEELEKAKEELQSTNQELMSMNDQACKRNLELAKLSDDLQNILAGVNIPIVMLEGDLRIRHTTPNAEKLLHVIPADIGRPITDIRMGFAIVDLDGLLSTVLREGRALEREVRGEDGRWYSLRLRPYWTGTGKIDGVLVALLDIHALKENQEAARRDERFLTAILEAADWTLLVVVLDPKGRIVHFNRACQVLTGYSLEEAKGMRTWEFLLPADELGGFKSVLEHLTPQTTQEHQSHWVTKDGRTRLIAWWINVTAEEDGRLQYVIGSGIDITERQQAREQARQSEATVRALLETAAQAIIGINAEGSVVLANAAAEKTFGYTREEMLDQPLGKLLPPRFHQQHLRDRAAFFEQTQNGALGRPDVAGLRKDGTEFPAEINLSHVATGEGSLAVAFITDITERKRNEEVLRRSEAEARASQQQLRELTGRLLDAQEEERRRISRATASTPLTACARIAPTPKSFSSPCMTCGPM